MALAILFDRNTLDKKPSNDLDCFAGMRIDPGFNPKHPKYVYRIESISLIEIGASFTTGIASGLLDGLDLR